MSEVTASARTAETKVETKVDTESCTCLASGTSMTSSVATKRATDETPACHVMMPKA